jgi:metallo-beta-lactamase class B
MVTMLKALFTGCIALLLAQSGASVKPDPPIDCTSCKEWNEPHEPFLVYGNTYYVGTAGLSAVLIKSDAGLILLDGGLTQSATLIADNIRSSGARLEDIRLIVNSHAHYDHAAGIAALQRVSGAPVAASPSGARALSQGYPTEDDPQYGSGLKLKYPAVKNVKVVKDGEVLRVGSLAITAHHTPGHTPGATTWTWQSCEQNKCLNMVYADSFSPVSDDGFKFTQQAGAVDAFRKSIATLEKLPCDVLLVPHPSAIEMDRKMRTWETNPAVNPFIDSNSCRSYAASIRKRLEARIASEK